MVPVPNRQTSMMSMRMDICCLRWSRGSQGNSNFPTRRDRKCVIRRPGRRSMPIVGHPGNQHPDGGKTGQQDQRNPRQAPPALVAGEVRKQPFTSASYKVLIHKSKFSSFGPASKPPGRRSAALPAKPVPEVVENALLGLIIEAIWNAEFSRFYCALPGGKSPPNGVSRQAICSWREIPRPVWP